jgi:diacylglycerol kinase (ATP)
MGPHRRLIIPPSSVGLKKQNWRGEEKVAVTTIAPPNLLGWRPLIVLSNTKSGGKDGHIVMSSLRKLLNPIQVIDLHKTTPEKALDMYCSVFSLPVRILVCGGDGTVGWVLSAIDKSKLSVKPHVGILPLGTGNDLARVLGWGPGYSPRSDDMSEILKEVEHSQLSVLDRWQVRIQSEKQYFKLKRTVTKVHVMNNYIGVGCDAGVALNFHRQRESYPELFASRLINKAWYLIFGAQDFMIPTCSDLTNKIKLYTDGVLQELPNLEGIVVLNINSWSSGCPMWSSNGEWGPSRMDDRMLEVVGLYSSFHVGRIQISASEPVRIGQSSNVKVCNILQ